MEIRGEKSMTEKLKNEMTISSISNSNKYQCIFQSYQIWIEDDVVNLYDPYLQLPCIMILYITALGGSFQNKKTTKHVENLESIRLFLTNECIIIFDSAVL